VILADGNIGIVKWGGKLDGEVKLGVRLYDGSNNGPNNNGVYNGVKYFECDEGRGVFAGKADVKRALRPEELLSKVTILNKKKQNLDTEIIRLQEQITQVQHDPKDYQRPGAKVAVVDDGSAEAVSRFLTNERNKKWYCSFDDFRFRYRTHNHNADQLRSWYKPFKDAFESFPAHPDHTRIVYTVCSSKKDNLLASGSDDKTIRLWRRNPDNNSPRCIATLSLRSCINALAFNPQGTTLAAALDSGWIELYDMTKGKMVGALEGQTTSEVWTITWAPDGANIVSGSLDRAVRIWDAKERECRWALRGHDEWVNGVAVSSDGTMIVSGSGDKTVKLWDTKTMACDNTIRGHSDFVRSVAVTDDNQYVVSASDDTTLRVWDIKKNKLHGVFKGHSKGIYCVSAGKGSMIASASRDYTIKCWDAADANKKNQKKQYKKEFKTHKGDVNSCCFFNNGEFVASGSDDKSVKLHKVF